MLVYIDKNRMKRFATTRHAPIHEIITTRWNSDMQYLSRNILNFFDALDSCYLYLLIVLCSLCNINAFYINMYLIVAQIFQSSWYNV